MIFPSNQEPTLPLNPGKEPLDDPTPLVAAQPPTVLRRLANAIGSVRCDHLGALLAQLCIQFVAVVRASANQTLQLRLDHLEVERQLDQRDFVVSGRMRRDRAQRAVPIADRRSPITMIFTPCPRLAGPISLAPPLVDANVATWRR